MILLLNLQFWTGAALAQGKASAHLDSSYILIGDQVRMQLFLDTEDEISNIRTDFSVWDSLTAIEIIQKGDWNRVGAGRNGGGALFEQRVVLTSFEAGRHVLPKTPVYFVANGRQDTLLPANTLTLEVGTIAVSDTTQLNPIKPIIEEPVTLEDYLPLAIGIAAFGLLASLIFLILWMRKRRREAPPPPPIVLKPHEIALQKLEALQQQQLWQQGQIKQYQTELTFIIREYLENQFQIPALENTTDEIIAGLQRIGFAPEWQERLRTVFENADLVKFAKAEPPLEIHTSAMQEALTLVLETKPQEEVGQKA